MDKNIFIRNKAINRLCFDDNIPSKNRLTNRWKHIKSIIPSKLKCYICCYEDNLNKFREYVALDIFEAGRIIRYECPKCNLIFGDLRFLNLSEIEISKDYQDVYTFFQEADTTNYIIESLKSVNCIDDKNKTYLDFACGDKNNIILRLKEDGYNIYGYDKYTNNQTYIMKELEDKKFDVIFSNNYIEHVIDPINDIKFILDHLNEDGKLVLISSCFEYAIEYTHYHTFFFIGKSLDILCEKVGMKLIESKKLQFTSNDFTYVKVFQKL
jgi:SAM-dependent methyltransferase